MDFQHHNQTTKVNIVAALIHQHGFNNSLSEKLTSNVKMLMLPFLVMI